MCCELRRVVLCLFVIAFIALGQDRGTISGTVSDNSGAIVPGAKIAVLNPETGFTQNMISNADGTYSFLYLASGKYNITAEKPGFPESRNRRHPGSGWARRHA